MTNTREHIKKLFSQSEDWSVVALTKELNVSKQLIHRILNDFVNDGSIIKLGLPPKTIYRSIKRDATVEEGKQEYPILNNHPESTYLKNHFLLITETGEYLEGIEGFSIWCQKRKLPLEKTIKEFKTTRLKYDSYYTKDGLVNGTEKLIQTKGYKGIYIDTLFYLDFYAIERFGKTKLGTILHFAKQGQNIFLMRILLNEIKTRLNAFLEAHQIEAIGFVPPTIKRETQLMTFLQEGLDIQLPLIQIIKISGLIAVPQKSLQKIEERINNADKTFTIPDAINYNKILLIDDAVGSGATINQISKKIKNKNKNVSIIGLALVGSFKGFDVITDV
jgi:hypothetical protein